MTPTSDDEFWSEIFGPAATSVRDGIRAAQEQHDAALLKRLDAQVDELGCDITTCDADATVAMYCRHTGSLMRVYCAEHREKFLALWRHETISCSVCKTVGNMPELVRFAGIFTTRARS